MHEPLILIPAHTEDIGKAAFYALRSTYADTIRAHVAVPLILPVVTGTDALESAMNAADGLLLPGGSDVDPRLYGEAPHNQLGRIERQLDDMELKLILAAYERDMPVLAICRGVQSLAVAMGGSLYQDLPSQCPQRLRHEVREFGRNHLAHEIELDPDSRLAQIMGPEVVGVNSFHHQGINRLPDALTVSAWSSDGQIEAVEDRNRAFVIGVQCHPEELWRESEPRFDALFAGFVAAAAAYGAGRG